MEPWLYWALIAKYGDVDHPAWSNANPNRNTNPNPYLAKQLACITLYYRDTVRGT